MDPMDDYLQDGFDPSTITVPRLRSILVTHNISYPATAKKQSLIDLFNEQVSPLAPRFLEQKAHARRTSKGIVNAGDPPLAPSSKAPPRSRSPRKSSAKRRDEESEATGVSSSRASRSHSRQPAPSDTESKVASDLGRPTRRSVTPMIKPEENSEPKPIKPSVEQESVFSTENPFQSGSSPPVAPSSRRRTTGTALFPKSPAAEPRRHTEGRMAEALQANLPLISNDSMLEPGEEFTPEEQLELEYELSKQANGELARLAKPSPQKRIRLGAPISVLLLTLVAAYLTWYRQEKVAVGYCGIGRPAVQILPPDVQMPEWVVHLITPQCEPCPQHAFCYSDASVVCESDFVLKPHPFALGGLIPFPPSCEPDSGKAKRVKAVADKAIDVLRERRARFECGDLLDDTGERALSPALEQSKLKEAVTKQRSKRLSDQEFDDLWAPAIGEVKRRDEIVIQDDDPVDADAVRTIQLSTVSLARLPLACTITRSTRLSLARYRFSIGLVTAVALAMAFATKRYRRHVAISAQIPDLVDVVLARLVVQHELGEDNIDDPWLFLPNLRDDVLRAIHSLAERERIWKRVRAVVEQNSNVRTGRRESRNGEVGRAWEWIGQAAGDAIARRRSGRVSFRPDVKRESPDQPERKVVFQSKSKEARPVF